MTTNSNNGPKGFLIQGALGVTRRTFTREALAAAIGAPLLANPAFVKMAKALDFSGQKLKFMINQPHAGSIEPLSFVALMSFAALQTQPQEVYEAAKLEIRSQWRVFRYITLPMLLPGLIGIAVLKLIIAFKVFDLIFVLTAGGPGQATTVSSFYIYRVAIQQFDIGLAATMTLLFAIVVGLATVPFTMAHDRAEARL